MPTDTRVIMHRLTARGNISKAQAEDIVDALFETEDPVVTKSVLRSELNRFAVKILLGVVAVNGALLAPFAYVLSAIGAFG